MAIVSCSVKIISRGKGRSAVAAAAYRAGEEMENAYDGLSHNYTRKTGIIHTDILTPAGAPDGAQDRQQLWNKVEQTERRKDAQLAREVMIALPRELPTEQNIEVARAYARTFVEQGMIADVSVHDNQDGNPHAHILLTMRPLEEESFGKKCRDWNATEKLIAWREQYEDITNQYLARYGHEQRIDVRSYAEQGIDQLPTVHLGPHAHRMEQQGIQTDRGDINREIEKDNRQLIEIAKEIALLEQERKRLQSESYESYNLVEYYTKAKEELRRTEEVLEHRLTEKGRDILTQQQKNVENTIEQLRQPAKGQDSSAPMNEPEQQRHSGFGELSQSPIARPQQQPEQPRSQEIHEASADRSRPPPLRRHRESRQLAQQHRTDGNARERLRQPTPGQEPPVHQTRPPSPGGQRSLNFDEPHDRSAPEPKPPEQVKETPVPQKRHLSSTGHREQNFNEPDRVQPTRQPPPPESEEASDHHSRPPPDREERKRSFKELREKLKKEHIEKQEQERDHKSHDGYKREK